MRRHTKKGNKGITLIALIITVIVMLILAAVAISLTIGDNGIFHKSKQGAEIYDKQEATEKLNLKITYSQMHTYSEKQRMPTLQELADDLCEDEEMEYVLLESKATASLEKVTVGNNKSIFTKIKKYPYEFEINGQLQLASIDGVKIANTDPLEGYMKIPTETLDINENGEYDVTDKARVNVNVDIPEDYMKKPTKENVLITEAKKNIDVTNYKSIDTSSLFESQGTGEGTYWNSGTTKINNGYASFAIDFIPTMTVIQMSNQYGYGCTLVIHGSTSGVVSNSGIGNGRK